MAESITIDLRARVVERDLNQGARSIQQFFDRAGREAGNTFGANFATGVERSGNKIRGSLDTATRATNRLKDAESRLHQAWQSGDRERVISATNNLARAHRNAATEAERLEKAQRSLVAATSGLGNGGSALANLSNIGNSLAGLGRIATPAAIGVAADMLVKLTGVAASASQSLIVLPGAVSAVGAAFGSAKLGLMGFGDALDNISDPDAFAASLAKLAPNAQQAALAIRNMLPALDQLRRATQDALFDGIAEDLTALSGSVLPTVQRMTTGIAGAFSEMGHELTRALQSADVQLDLSTFASNAVNGFRALAPAIQPVVTALADLVSTGSGVLPDIAQGAADAAESFASFLREAQQSGQLDEWLSNGLSTMQLLGDIAYDVGRAFMTFAGEGQKELPKLADAVDRLADSMGVLLEVLKLVENTAKLVYDPIAGITGFAEQLGLIDPQPMPEYTPSNPNALRDMMVPPAATTPGPGAPSAPIYGALGVLGAPGANVAAPTTQGPTTGPFAVPSAGGDWWKQGGNTAKLNLPPTTSASDYVDRLIQKGNEAKSNSGRTAERNAEGLVPNAALLKSTLQQLFPGVTIGGYSPNVDQPWDEHQTGEALDIMVGQNRQLGDTINRWLLQNASAFGIQYDLWRQSQWNPSGEIRPMPDRGSPTENHMDHVHVRTSPGDPANGLYMPPGASPYQPGVGSRGSAPIPVSVQDFSGQATGQIQDSLGIDQDLGLSRGLGGLVENLTKAALGGLVSPITDQLKRIAGPDSGSGIIGMNAQQNIASGRSPILGQPLTTPAIAGYQAAQQPQWSADWNAMAQKESGGNWAIDTGNGYQGGLQFSPSSWAAADGTQYAPSANLATPYQQALTAENLLRMQGPGAWPNTFTPGSSGPAATGVPPQGPPSYAAPQEGWKPGGGGFNGIGGLPLAAAVSAAGAAFPGGGAAAQTAMQLINRSIGYAGQAAGIGVNGLIETFGLGDLADPSKSWFGRILSGFAGAGAAIPNSAGNTKPAGPQQQDANQPRGDAKQGAANGFGAGVHIHGDFIQAENRQGQQVLNDMAFASYQQGGR